MTVKCHDRLLIDAPCGLTMPRLHSSFFSVLACMLVMLATLPACSPALNWREVRLESTRLALLLPCKPDKAEKVVPLGGQPTVLTMMGCNAGGATFAVAVADLGDASKADAVLAQWQALTLANMMAPPAGVSSPALSGASSPASAATAAAPSRQATQTLAFKLAGVGAQPSAVLVKAFGSRADGRAVAGQAAYFAQGSQVFQAVLYADRIPPELGETFFSSIKFE